MHAPLIMLHPEALRATHPVFTAAPAGTRAVFAWDDAYMRAAGYSFKRLVFIYETLCELPLDILQGTMADVVTTLAPTIVYMPVTHNPLLSREIETVAALAPMQLVADEPFAHITKPGDLRRFFPYWNQAQKTAFLPNGGSDA